MALSRRAFVVLVVCVSLVVSGHTNAQDIPPEPPHQVVLKCRRLMARPATQTSGVDAPRVILVQPSHDQVVYGRSVTVLVKTLNFPINQEGRHWHLWVNGQLMMMGYSEALAVPLAPGHYQICVTLSDGMHGDVGMPDGVNITLKSELSASATTDAPHRFPDISPNRLVVSVGSAFTLLPWLLSLLRALARG